MRPGRVGPPARDPPQRQAQPGLHQQLQLPERHRVGQRQEGVHVQGTHISEHINIKK